MNATDGGALPAISCISHMPSPNVGNHRKPKLAELTAVRIEAEIIRQGWPEGKQLGSEPEMLAWLGVSRAVFREAVRLLEHHGVASAQRGSGGGLIVRHPDPSSAVRPVALYLEYARVNTDQLFTVRRTLESMAVQLATEAITEADIATIRTCLAAEDSMESEVDEAIHDFHIVLARISGNPALSMFIEILARVTNDTPGPAALFLPGEKFERPQEIIDDVHRAHEAIAEAVIAGDAALASRRMLKHLDSVAAAVATVRY